MRLQKMETFLTSQQLGGMFVSLIWQLQIVLMASPLQSIRPSTEDLLDSSRRSHLHHGDHL